MTEKHIHELIETLQGMTTDLKYVGHPGAGDLQHGVNILKAIFTDEKTLDEVPVKLDFEIREGERGYDMRSQFSKVVGEGYKMLWTPPAGEYWGKHVAAYWTHQKEFLEWLKEHNTKGADVLVTLLWNDGIKGNRENFAWNEVEKLRARADSALHLLEEAAKQFRLYEENHRAKNTKDSLKKAEVNAEMAKKIEEFLAKCA